MRLSRPPRSGSTPAQPSQPGLFDDGPLPRAATAPSADAALADRLAAEHAAAEAIARRLPAEVRFGTSSWSFPGWAGIVYGRRRSSSALARDGLAEYARHPLLRTVGIDRGFYAPIPPADLRDYAGQLPDGFPCLAKAPEAVTSPVRVGGGPPNGGVDNGHGPAVSNPDFLSAERFVAEMVAPFLADFAGHTGPFLLQFPPAPAGHRLAAREFAAALDRFLAGLPRAATYAVELRDRTLLGAEYRDVIARHGVAHVYNYATAMPLPEEQERIVPLDTAGFVVVRLLLRPDSRYRDRRERYAPFDRLVDPDPVMRDQVEALLRRAVAARQMSFVLVNNKAEGSAPLTIRALAERLAGGSCG